MTKKLFNIGINLVAFCVFMYGAEHIAFVINDGLHWMPITPAEQTFIQCTDIMFFIGAVIIALTSTSVLVSLSLRIATLKQSDAKKETTLISFSEMITTYQESLHKIELENFSHANHINSLASQLHSQRVLNDVLKDAASRWQYKYQAEADKVLFLENHSEILLDAVTEVAMMQDILKPTKLSKKDRKAIEYFMKPSFVGSSFKPRDTNKKDNGKGEGK